MLLIQNYKNIGCFKTFKLRYIYVLLHSVIAIFLQKIKGEINQMDKTNKALSFCNVKYYPGYEINSEDNLFLTIIILIL